MLLPPLLDQEMNAKLIMPLQRSLILPSACLVGVVPQEPSLFATKRIFVVSKDRSVSRRAYDACKLVLRTKNHDQLCD